MKKIRDGLLGNFIPLANAARALGDRVQVSMQEIDRHLSLNRPNDESLVRAQRDAIASHLGFAHGASRLLQLMNRPADSRPKWYDAGAGYPILDDSLGRKGLNILTQWAKLVWPSESKTRSGSTSEIPPLHHQGPDGGPMDLGFDTDELIQFVDAEDVAHTLGKHLNSVVDAKPSALATKDAPASLQPAKRRCRINGPLRHVVPLAVEKVGDDHVAVFALLCEWAALDKPERPIPLIRYQDDAVWYEDPDTQTGEAPLKPGDLLDRAYFKNKSTRRQLPSARRGVDG